MIVWDGFTIITLILFAVLLIMVGIGYVVIIIHDWFKQRRNRKNQEWWDKREREGK